MITVNVNNQSHSIKKESSLKELIAQLRIVTQGIAVAVNHTIIPHTDWSTIKLQSEDTILIIQATQGG